jgi:hypothetical protein
MFCSITVPLVQSNTTKGTVIVYENTCTISLRLRCIRGISWRTLIWRWYENTTGWRLPKLMFCFCVSVLFLFCISVFFCSGFIIVLLSLHVNKYPLNLLLLLLLFRLYLLLLTPQKWVLLEKIWSVAVRKISRCMEDKACLLFSRGLAILNHMNLVHNRIFHCLLPFNIGRSKKAKVFPVLS